MFICSRVAPKAKTLFICCPAVELMLKISLALVKSCKGHSLNSSHSLRSTGWNCKVGKTLRMPFSNEFWHLFAMVLRSLLRHLVVLLVIHLDRATGRWKEVQELCEQLGVAPVRLSAVDGHQCLLAGGRCVRISKQMLVENNEISSHVRLKIFEVQLVIALCGMKGRKHY